MGMYEMTIDRDDGAMVRLLGQSRIMIQSFLTLLARLRSPAPDCFKLD